MDLNQKLFDLFYGLSHKSALLDALFVFFAQYLTYFLVLAVAVWIFGFKGRRRLFIAAELALSAILARGLLTEWIRFFYVHPRPMDLLGLQSLIPESGNSFPSGHMTFLFSLASVVFFYRRKFGGFLMLLVLMVGAARIVAGVHWPLDIVGGILIGFLSAGLIHLPLRRYWQGLMKKTEEAEAVS